jgi:hypothetical protein
VHTLDVDFASTVLSVHDVPRLLLEQTQAAQFRIVSIQKSSMVRPVFTPRLIWRIVKSMSSMTRNWLFLMCNFQARRHTYCRPDHPTCHGSDFGVPDARSQHQMEILRILSTLSELQSHDHLSDESMRESRSCQWIWQLPRSGKVGLRAVTQLL